MVKSKLRPRVSHHQHTGKKLPVEHTSYSLLFFIIAFISSFVLFLTLYVQAGPPQSQSGNIQLSGVVPGDPPSVPAVITNPTDNQHVTDSIITVSGTCTPTGVIVEIMRNGAFAGSTICNASEGFSLSITLIPGANQLIARVSDDLGQYGPDSALVTVYLDEGAIANDGTPSSVASSPLPLLIYTDIVQRGSNPGQTISVPYEVNGGVNPYAVSVSWDDSSPNTLTSLLAPGDFEEEHLFDKPGQYQVIFRATDHVGNEAIAQTIVIINGQFLPGAADGEIPPSDSCNTADCLVEQQLIQTINTAWPAMGVAAALTLSFWFGEKLGYAKHLNTVTTRKQHR